MEWKKEITQLGTKVPILSWSKDIESNVIDQAINAASLPCAFKHVALMADAHCGFGVPIGTVLALDGAICVNAIGVDIGCGMGSLKTDRFLFDVSRAQLAKIVELIHRNIPTGEGHAHKESQDWFEFTKYEILNDKLPAWFDGHVWHLAALNLGTLGGGNHFIELQRDKDGRLFIMIHSGSRNLGHVIASYYNKVAFELNRKWHSYLPNDDLAFLPASSDEGIAYIRDMNFALEYAQENRKRIMDKVKYIVMDVLGGFNVVEEINIHHNYASLENHMGKNVWVHRKGATSAREGQMGIIPGSMGTASYIVRGKGNPLSFMSCSHGAGRVLGRNDASRTLSKEECDNDMEGIVFRGFNAGKKRGKRVAEWDLGEAPKAYKNIDTVIKAQEDLVDVVTRLVPIAVAKG